MRSNHDVSIQEAYKLGHETSEDFGAEDATCMCGNTQQWSMAVSTQIVTIPLLTHTEGFHTDCVESQFGYVPGGMDQCAVCKYLAADL